MSTKTCATCGKELESTGRGPLWMNSYQWGAYKAGDYYAACERATHPNGNCYFWKVDKSSDPLAPDAALSDAKRERI